MADPPVFRCVAERGWGHLGPYAHRKHTPFFEMFQDFRAGMSHAKIIDGAGPGIVCNYIKRVDLLDVIASETKRSVTISGTL